MNQPPLPPSESSDVQTIPFWNALKFWWKLGWISFGGPAGQIALMHQELVENKKWISEKRFLHALNYCMLLPGPEAQQLATYIGWLMHKTMGALVAGLLFILPSLFLIIGLSWIYIQFGDVPFIAGLFYGIKPAVTAIVFHATYRIAKRSLKNRILWIIAAMAFISIFILKLPFPLIILAAALLGFILGQYFPQYLSDTSQHATPTQDYGPAYIDDHTPTPAHAMFKWSRLFKVVLFGAILWCLPMLSLSLSLGWEHPYTQMAWFFTKAALLTFGGAYAVLPYVYQGAVHHYGWLSASQMIDGLALGESTPGPLIMIVAYVGFLGGFSQAVLGNEHVFLAGVIGACIATWFTFLFSFIFILAGAPLIESTQHQIKLTAPLTAITAAVVGVILNLALFFAYHVLWPQGFSAELDWIALLLTLMATALLFYFEWNVMKVLFISAVLGLLVYLF
ncbi:chromate efflux transporter [Acinetobacter zhairhuonensis]|uniref:chromate efflux transporter n=1 Tax=Acinetobacter sp. A7.4 TaxID=2919921 RepID=UPI001F4E5CFB|nr:chromate efflux transporter [Acinetobacter sp. A7.4]MCJ8160302.1 chromate efflux transporter [Acinetobacter sp. A7.4]